MNRAKPVWEAMDTHGFGLGALLLALLVPGSAWLVAQASLAGPRADDARRIEFVRASAGIQGRLGLLRELEKAELAGAAQAGYFRAHRAGERRRIDELARSAAAAAEGSEEQARLALLAVLVRAADARYEQVLALAGEARGARHLAMQK